MKKLSSFLIIFICIFVLSGCSNKNKEDNTNSNMDTSRLSTNNTVNQNTTLGNTIQTPPTPDVVEIEKNAHSAEPIEEEIALFTTKLSGKDSPRTHNISITTIALNGKTVEPEKTFSFCDTIGVSTAEKGYEKADSFDSDGNKIQTLGGGNCQVSSTLYNAVLKVIDLKVTERHPHSNKVHYVPENKDAAVAHGSVDLKFKNNTGNTIKIYANSDLKAVNIRIVRLI